MVADEPAPQALKKYRLLGRLAKGGMAEVFLARANGLGGFERLLVIKRILPELSRDTEFVRMFLDEARTAATLQHSNIVQVYDVDMVDGHVFYAMEHLHGQHAGAMLERAKTRATRVPLENAIAIAVAVAAGLHYAHERWGADGRPLDIVHRDVAPNNVVVTYDGNVKLIDFGIAKAANNLSSTRFGLFKGKLPYASPEQCRCQPVDRRTDVFSLGVMLYELTTGQQLFTGDSDYELMRVMTEAVVPRPRLRDKAYPAELEAIVLKALAREPGERYQSAHALQRDLEVFAGKSRFDLSAFSLSRLMEGLFQKELHQWKTAQSAGLTLEQHITRTTSTWSRAVDTEEIHEIEDLVDGRRITRTTSTWSLETRDVIHSVEPDATKPGKAATSIGKLGGRAGLARHARTLAVALGLVGAGAASARWAISGGDAPAGRAPSAAAPPPAAASAPNEPVAASAPNEPAVAPAPSEPAVAVALPAHGAASPTSERAVSTPRKMTKKRTNKRARASRAAASLSPAAPLPPTAHATAPANKVLDEATLDQVVPRTTRSP